MTDMAPEAAGSVILKWWKQHLRPDTDTGLARGLRARLRRAGTPVDVLAEPQAVALYDALGRRVNVMSLAALLPVLALVEKNEPTRAAKRFSVGEPPPLSDLRFQRLIRSSDAAELAVALRRALPRIDHSCNVPALSEDVLWWNERVRIRWCLDYFGKTPREAPQDKSETEETA